MATNRPIRVDILARMPALEPQITSIPPRCLIALRAPILQHSAYPCPSVFICGSLLHLFLLVPSPARRPARQFPGGIQWRVSLPARRSLPAVGTGGW